MLASFRIVPYSVTRFSSPNLCTPPLELKSWISPKFQKTFFFWKSTYYVRVMLILWAYFCVYKSLQVWRPCGLMFGTIFEIVICAGNFLCFWEVLGCCLLMLLGNLRRSWVTEGQNYAFMAYHTWKTHLWPHFLA